MPRQRDDAKPSFKYLKDYAWASIWGAGDAVARILNIVSLIGVSLIVILGIVFKSGPVSLLIAFIAFVLLMLLTHYGSFRAYQTERQGRETLEEAARPRLTVQCKQESGLRVGEERGALAYLEVTNRGGGHVRNAYVRVEELVEHAPASGSVGPYRQRRDAHQDIFLKWDASDTKLNSFHGGAKVRVAYGRTGDGRYGLTTIGKGTVLSLRLFEDYELTLEIAGDDIAPLREKFLLRMEQTSYMHGRQKITPLDAPYTVEFREWRPSDRVEGEFDIDAWEQEQKARREQDT